MRANAPHVPHIFSDNPNDLQGHAGQDVQYVTDYKAAMEEFKEDPLLAEKIVGKGLKGVATRTLYVIGFVSSRTVAAIDHINATKK